MEDGVQLLLLSNWTFGQTLLTGSMTVKVRSRKKRCSLDLHGATMILDHLPGKDLVKVILGCLGTEAISNKSLDQLVASDETFWWSSRAWLHTTQGQMDQFVADARTRRKWNEAPEAPPRKDGLLQQWLGVALS